jgi:hypothetical protein
MMYQLEKNKRMKPGLQCDVMKSPGGPFSRQSGGIHTTGNQTKARQHRRSKTTASGLTEAEMGMGIIGMK